MVLLLSCFNDASEKQTRDIIIVKHLKGPEAPPAAAPRLLAVLSLKRLVLSH